MHLVSAGSTPYAGQSLILIRSRPIQDHGGMAPDPSDSEQKFTKSKSNQGVQKAGKRLMLLDPRFQDANLATRRAILVALGNPAGYGLQTFDLLMRPVGTPELTPENVAEYLPTIRLVEMKATKKPIKGPALNGFFFGATENEVRMAKALGGRYLFAFVVLNAHNEFKRPFARLLTLDEVEARTKVPWRTQYQVNFKTGMSGEGLVADGEAIIVLDHLEPEPPSGY